MRYLPESLRNKLNGFEAEEDDLCFSGGENDVSVVVDKSTDKLQTKTTEKL
jgi:hypothetical protein